MISPARFREIKQMIHDCPPGEPVCLDKTTAMALLTAAGVGMMADLELQGKLAWQKAQILRGKEEKRRAERMLNAIPK